ncbi:S1C family serine protease [Bacillus mesophilum]|uniref:PDZ domain-containing protein n=1 Tax=Bacillus mesophilum TaxID=1071718 RepID=A0A7V7RKP2_9BACI|nr:trypsin-like peptidase domain-containing protein [Bacillus mesophilum]KAB2331848.1 PDZ domain-containing protein [Bacillus mesophilum]
MDHQNENKNNPFSDQNNTTENHNENKYDTSFNVQQENDREDNAQDEIVQEKSFQPESSEGSRVSVKETKKSGKWGGFMKTIAAGVIGSALTLTALPFVESAQDDAPGAVSQTETAVSDVNVQKVNSAATGNLADTIEQASKAIVGIVNYQDQQQVDPFGRAVSGEEAESGSGSGVIFKMSDGEAFIVTNNHVIENASKVEVTLHDGEKLSAELVGTDPLTDIAVIKIKGDISAEVLPFGDSSKLRAGEQVLAIGNPLGLDLSRTVTQGIVSAVDRSIAVSTSAGEWDLDVIQTDAAINPGNSGGALINSAGELVGINSLKISESGVEGLGFAIPSNDVEALINQLIEDGQVERPYLGVGLAALEEIPQFYLRDVPENVTAGAIITNVDESSAAAKAGLQAEDIIVSIGGTKVTGPDDLRKALYTDFKIGDNVTVEYYRQGELKEVKVTLASKQLETE